MKKSTNYEDSKGTPLILIAKYRTAIMGLAALWIWIFHIWKLVLPSQMTLAIIEKYIQRTGEYGVDIFFLLSGFGLMFSDIESGLASFYWRRIKKVYPCFLLEGLYRWRRYNWSLLTFFQNITMFSFFYRNTLAFLWNIPALMILYCLFPLLRKTIRSVQRPLEVLLSYDIMWLFASIVFRNSRRQDFSIFTNRIPDFLTGMMYGHVVKTSAPSFSYTTWLLVYLLFFLGIYLGYLTCFERYPLVVWAPWNGFPSSLIAASFTLIVSEILHTLLNSSRFSVARFGLILHSVLHFYGTITLELFATQQDVRRLMEPFFYHKPNLSRNVAMLTVQTLVAYTEHRLLDLFCIFVNAAWKK